MAALTPESGRLSPAFLATFLGCTTSAAWTLDLAQMQGRVAEQSAVMLGSGDPAVLPVTQRFRLAEVRHYVRRAARRLERFATDTPIDLESEPCGHCGKCEWRVTCEEAWTASDHLCRVADISRRQRQRLMEAGNSTLTLLGALEAGRVLGIGAETLSRLVQLARLQCRSADEDRLLEAAE
ncbi:hypothetical protein ACQKJ1_27175 [Methylorubrum rhodesianum]|uniref:hypothetical protein n=1 Tax=Methylorubrum rhodesianum TaxID=29427 RepID=UPI003CFC53AF